MKETWKRMIALILAMAMCLSLLSVNVWAGEVVTEEAETSAVDSVSSEYMSVSAHSDGEDAPSDEEHTEENEDDTEDYSMSETEAESGREEDNEPEEEESAHNQEKPDKGRKDAEEDEVGNLTTQGTVYSGNCGAQGNNLTWTLDDKGTLTIRGTGEMKNYNSYNSHSGWESQNERIRSIVLEEGLTSIGTNAFIRCKGIDSVTIPDSVTSIGSYAFSDCVNLTSLIIPDNVTSIAYQAFASCTGLTNVTIGNGVTSIDAEAFSCCYWLNEINVSPDNETYSSDDGVLFSKDKTAILLYPEGKNEVYSIPENVTTIGAKAFLDCTKLSDVTIPEGVIDIGDTAFMGCESLTSIVIPSSVASIGDDVFSGCRSLISATIQPGVTSIGRGVFRCCENLTNISIPYGVTSIGDASFEWCFSLANVTIPSSVTSIGDCAFSDCRSVTNIIIPPSVTTIGDYSFYGCDSITSIIIPSSVTIIGDGMLKACANLKNVVFLSSACSIGNFMFSECTNLTNVTLPSSLTRISGDMFSDCEKLPAINIPSSVTSIDRAAFAGCIKLDRVTIPSSVTSIESYAFSGCNSLTSVMIPSSLTRIKDATFYGCSNLTSVTISKSITVIDAKAFDGCTDLTDVFFSGSQEEWNAISIGENNAPLTNATIHYNSTGPGSSLGNTDVDDYLIDQVSRYTRAGAYGEFDRIMNANYDSKELFRRICELTQNLNITDPVEGVRYLGDRDGYKWDYNYLINDNAYCANNYFDWMHNTTKGKAARVALVGSGLIYNYELASYVNPFTYLNEDTPGVKRKRELLKTVIEDITGDKSDDGITVSSVISNSKKVGKLAKNMIKINNLTNDAELNDLTTRIINCKDAKQLDRLQGQFAEMLVSKCNTVGSKAIYCDVEMTSKALGYATPILSFVGAAAGDIEEMINLEKDIENYEACKRFLLNVYNDSSISLSMRTAAYQLLDDIDNGYFNKVKSVLLDVMEFGNNMMRSLPEHRCDPGIRRSCTD